MRFEELRLAEPILRAVAAEGYVVPTPIQAQAIPHVIAGHDLLGCAQTGTGKTAAFALPILHRLIESRVDNRFGHGVADRSVNSSGRPGRNGHGANGHRAHGWSGVQRSGPGADRPRHGARPIRCLVLSPTRELALQIAESFRTYGRFAGLRHCVIYGGVSQHGQTRDLEQGVDILVATPGRLLDLMNQGYVDLGHVEVFVLDEADRMLDMGFIPDVRRIVAKLPSERQTLFFSATMPPEIRKLADTILRRPVSVQVAAASATADNVEQSVYFVDKPHKPSLLTRLLSDASISRVLIFTRTKHGADRVARDLHRAGIRAEAIHGEKSQNARQRALGNFRSNKTSVLVATDIAARGLDIDEISHVINYDLPNVPETYVHRIGRTARAGAAGIALSFCDQSERPHLKAIERLIRRAITVQHAEGTNSVATRVADSHARHRPAPVQSRRQSGGRRRNRSRRFSRVPS